MQRNTGSRNPYSGARGQQNRPRNPYGSAQRPPASRGEPARRSSSAQRTARPSGTARPNRQTGSRSATGQRRSGYAAPPKRGGAGGGRRGGYGLNGIGRLVLLALALLIIAGAVFGIVHLIRGGQSDVSAANIPQKVPEGTESPTVGDEAAATDDPNALEGADMQTVEPLESEAATETEQPAVSNGLRSATIRNVGDFVIHEPIFKSAKQEDGSYDFIPMLTYIKESMGNADYTVANVDGPMGGAGKRGYKGYPQFNTPPHLMLALLDAGVDMLTLSNNHALDTYFDGLKAEIENCIQCGMAYVGGARTQEEHDTPVIKEVNGIKIGFLNYTESANTMEKYSDADASVYGINFARKADFDADVQAARSAGAEVVVAYMHWGTEYERTADSNQQTYAKKLVAAGVDVIIGSHPHVVQPAYWLSGTRNSDGGTQRTLCLCSLGNFLSDQRAQYRDGGIIFEFTIQETSAGVFDIVSPKYIPTYVWRTGDDDSGYTYRVVPCGVYLDSAPDGMSDSDHARLVEVWQETIEQMNRGDSNAEVVAK